VTAREDLDIRHARVLDGAMATELESRGASISGPLWSAHVLEDAPEKILAVHRAYLEAGADILLTAGYQVSRKGYAEFGLDPALADRALMQSVSLAAQARSEFPNRKILIAASLGPFGAALHNGAEYHGRYDCTFADLVDFHQQRIAVLAESSADIVAFETLPSLEEARAIGEALKPWPHLAAWFSFTCPEPGAASLQVAHGELLRDCASLTASFPQTVAIGVNCTHPARITSLIAELRSASSRPIVVYPNSGEGWNAKDRCWVPAEAAGNAQFGKQAQEWFAAGAQIVGGCCRVGPACIAEVASAAAND
jgi:homocysteine S-methyltransferase